MVAHDKAALELVMPSRTVEQAPGLNGFAKAGELIEVRTPSLGLEDRRVLNLLYEHAGKFICDDVEHVVSMSQLKSKHKGATRVKDSITRLMTTLVLIPVVGRNGKPSTKRLQLLAETTVSDDDDDPTGEVSYSFAKGMRAIIKDSTYWGRVRGSILFAFTSKYSLTLYEMIALRINLNKREEEMSLQVFRELMGVADDKLQRAPDLLRFCVKPAVLEVNALCDFGVRIEPVRVGNKLRGRLTGFRLHWWPKDEASIQATAEEMTKPVVGRLGRIRKQEEEKRKASLSKYALPPLKG